jgi:tetratricopeptide (TPR) repeat protein
MSLLPSSWSRLPTAGDEQPLEVERRRLRKLLISIGVVVVALGAAALWLGPKITRRLEQRSVRQAREFLQQQDYRRAQLMLEQAVQDNPSDFETRRELAKFYQEANSARAFAAWRSLVQDDPANDENRLGLATAGLRLNDIPAARDALSGMSAAGRATAEYHRIAAGIAMRMGDQAALAAELAALASLEPDDPRAQFDHALLELASGDEARMEAARGELIKLAQAGPTRIRATLELIRDATRRGGLTVYTDLADRLLPSPGGFPVPPWLAQPRGLFDLILYMEGQPDPQPDDAAMLAEWLRRQGLAADAVFWLGSLSPAVENAAQVLPVRVACLVQINDWKSVEAGLRAGAWGRAPGDAISLAFAAHLQQERLHPDHSIDTWNDAIEISARSPEALRVLLRLSRAFGWRDQERATLLALTQAAPRDPEAWQSLAIEDAASGDTEKLYGLYQDWSRAVPDDPAVRGVMMWVAVLLKQAGPEDFKVSGAIDPAYAAAQALALRDADRAGEAEAVLAQLPPAARRDARVALVEGLLFAEAGRRAESEQALAVAAAAPLLPEERQLIGLARHLNGS